MRRVSRRRLPRTPLPPPSGRASGAVCGHPRLHAVSSPPSQRQLPPALPPPALVVVVTPQPQSRHTVAAMPRLPPRRPAHTALTPPVARVAREQGSSASAPAALLPPSAYTVAASPPHKVAPVPRLVSLVAQARPRHTTRGGRCCCRPLDRLSASPPAREPRRPPLPSAALPPDTTRPKDRPPCASRRPPPYLSRRMLFGLGSRRVLLKDGPPPPRLFT